MPSTYFFYILSFGYNGSNDKIRISQNNLINKKAILEGISDKTFIVTVSKSLQDFIRVFNIDLKYNSENPIFYKHQVLDKFQKVYLQKKKKKIVLCYNCKTLRECSVILTTFTILTIL